MKKGFGKKGISAVVATVLIILMTVAAVAIIWYGIVPIISGLYKVNTNADLQLVAEEGYTIWDEENRLVTVQVERGTDEADLIGFDLIFTLGGDSIRHFVDDALEINSRGVYYINLSNYSGDLDLIRLAPVFKRGIIGEVVSELRIDRVAKDDLIEAIEEGKIDEDFVAPSGGYSSGGGGGGGGTAEIEETGGEEEVATQCSQCGEGLLNDCDRDECEAFSEGCYFINNILFDECSPCSGAGCLDYDDDEETCTGDVCGFGSCLWSGGLCSAGSNVYRIFSSTLVNQSTEVDVTLDISIVNGETFYAIEEHIPSGWTVIDDGGGSTSVSTVLKWANFTDMQDISYTVQASSSAGDYDFSGSYMFEGFSGPGVTMGQTAVTVV